MPFMPKMTQPFIISFGLSNKSDIKIIKPLFLIDSASECKIGDILVSPLTFDECNTFNK